ncbi:uncharacterized protein UV8b_01490 [Ustilaginoidea virens]|uniref:Uncharacterized protein n=1 Tax=Ustilaginoidea virens TaxID=1159556 RepID=A0A8E5HLP8_USTVR|nr:uncharacterized protein UV8b_01490 [Ustilaginoidea virens]QUC17249.1 hypothetical protein UV8b_01490 [Ustilaginoidea virens]
MAVYIQDGMSEGTHVQDDGIGPGNGSTTRSVSRNISRQSGTLHHATDSNLRHRISFLERHHATPPPQSFAVAGIDNEQPRTTGVTKRPDAISVTGKATLGPFCTF